METPLRSASALVSRPEARLLLCCARTTRSRELAEQIRALIREDVDWEYLLQLAYGHAMAPLLYWHLDAACPEAVPESILTELKDHFRASSQRNLFFTGELLKILNLFEAHGISAVPYKGPTLAAYAYGNLALRQFVDLDIMVHRHDVLRAKEILASLGYRPPYPLTRAQEALLLESRFGPRCEYPLTRDDEQSAVELRWDISEHFSSPLDPERLWERLEKISLGGAVVPTLSPEDTLLTLCAHGSKHLWERLAWICDLAELIRARQDIDWEQVLAQASRLGGERMVFLGLFLANDLLGAVLPEQVLRRVHADPVVKALAREVHKQLFRKPGDQAEAFELAIFSPLHLKMKKRLADKISLCVRSVTAPSIEDWKLLPLPRFLSPLYHVLRPIRLAGKYGLRILQGLS